MLGRVSGAEYALLGYLLLGTVVAFFGVALPGYWLLRRVFPESGWNLGGSVSVSAIRAFDLAAVGAFVAMYVLAWEGLLEGRAEITAERLVAGGVGMLMLAAVVPLLLFWRVDVLEYLGLRWREWRLVFIIAPVFVVGVFVVNLLVYFTGWPGWVEARFGGEAQEMVLVLMGTRDWRLMLAAVFAAVVVAPVAEELIFRAYIYPVVKRFSEKWFAALFSAMLFGVIHFNLKSFPVLMLMGLALVALYEVTGSIWPPIACHALFNATTMMIIFSNVQAP